MSKLRKRKSFHPTPELCYTPQLRRNTDDFFSDLDASEANKANDEFFFQRIITEPQELEQRRSSTRSIRLTQHQRLRISVGRLASAMLAYCLVLALFDLQKLLSSILSILLFAPYPPHFPRFLVLIPLLAPYGAAERLEIVVFLGVASWLSLLNWAFVFNRMAEAVQEFKETMVD